MRKSDDKKKTAQSKFYQYNTLINSVIILACISVSLSLGIYLHVRHLTKTGPSVKTFTYKGYDFSTDRIRQDIQKVTKIGSRMFTSKENRQASEFMYQELQKLTKTSLMNCGSDCEFSPNVELFLQDGTYTITIIQRLSNFLYQQIPNIVVTLKSKTLSSKTDEYCMMNCHYDSANGSPGASDNMINCALMMEVMRYYTQMTSKSFSSNYPNMNCHLLFLFNGAEEAAMGAANSFITKHPLKDKIKALLNFDSSGTGGRSMLFQTTVGASDLLRNYASAVPHPFGTCIAEEIFRTGLLPVDTDFQIFRDFGGLHGIDIAFIGNGHQYHNQYDKDEFIPDGTINVEIQNMISLVDSVVTSSEDSKQTGYENYVYFDYMHYFMVIYSMSTAFYVNLTVAACYIIVFVFEVLLRHRVLTNTQLFVCLSVFGVTHLLSTVLSMVGVLLLSVAVTLLDAHLSWFTYTFVSVLLYGLPALIQFVVYEYFFIEVVFKKYTQHLTTGQKDTIMFHSYTFLPLMMLLLATWFEIRSGYLLVFCMSTLLLCKVIRLLMMVALRPFLTETSIKTLYLTVHSLITSVITAYGAYLLSFYLESVVPIFDRTGCDVPAESVMAFSAAFMFLLLAYSITSLLYRYKSSFVLLAKVIFVAWLVVLTLVVTGIIPAFVPVYGPKRLILSHHERLTLFNGEKVTDQLIKQKIQHKYDQITQFYENTGLLVITVSDQACLRGFGKYVMENFEKLVPIKVSDTQYADKINDDTIYGTNAFSLIEEFYHSIYYHKTVRDMPINLPERRQKLVLKSRSHEKIPTNEYEYLSKFEFEYYGDEMTIMDILLEENQKLVEWSFDFNLVPNGKQIEKISKITGKKVKLPIYNIILMRSDVDDTVSFWLKIRHTVTDKSNELLRIVTNQISVDDDSSAQMDMIVNKVDKHVAYSTTITRWYTNIFTVFE